MKNNTKNNELLIARIKIILSSLGLSETFVAYQYITDIIVYMLENGNSSRSYRLALKEIENKYSITSRGLSAAIKRVINKCNNPQLFNTPSSLKSYTVYNKINAIYSHILSTLNI